MLTPGDLKAERLPGEFFRMLLRGSRGDDDAVMLGWYLIRCMYVITEDCCVVGGKFVRVTIVIVRHLIGKDSV